MLQYRVITTLLFREQTTELGEKLKNTVSRRCELYNIILFSFFCIVVKEIVVLRLFLYKKKYMCIRNK